MDGYVTAGKSLKHNAVRVAASEDAGGFPINDREKKKKNKNRCGFSESYCHFLASPAFVSSVSPFSLGRPPIKMTAKRRMGTARTKAAQEDTWKRAKAESAKKEKKKHKKKGDSGSLVSSCEDPCNATSYKNKGQSQPDDVHGEQSVPAGTCFHFFRAL